MATSLPSAHPSANQVWASSLFLEKIRKVHFYDNIGEEGSDALVWKYDELKKGAGDTITINFLDKVGGVGRGESQRVEGYEADQVVQNDTFYLGERAHAVRNKSSITMSAQRAKYWPELQRKSRTQLAQWHAARDNYAFMSHLTGNTAVSFALEGETYAGTDRLLALGHNYATAPSATRFLRAGGQANDESLTSADKFTLPFLDAMIETTKIGGSNRMEPTKRGYILYLPTEVIVDLRRDTTSAIQWYDINLAKIQGGMKESDFFAKAIGMYADAVEIYVSDYMPRGVHSSTGAQVSNTRRIALCGRGAIGYGHPGGKPSEGGGAMNWSEKEFDYGREIGVMGLQISGMKKLVSNGEDHAVVAASVYAAPHTS